VVDVAREKFLIQCSFGVFNGEGGGFLRWFAVSAKFLSLFEKLKFEQAIANIISQAHCLDANDINPCSLSTLAASNSERIM